MPKTKRRSVNSLIEKSVSWFHSAAHLALISTRVVNKSNFDLSKLELDKAIEWLEISLAAAHDTKREWLKVSTCVADIITNLDWYIARIYDDLKRYRKRRSEK